MNKRYVQGSPLKYQLNKLSKILPYLLYLYCKRDYFRPVPGVCSYSPARVA